MLNRQNPTKTNAWQQLTAHFETIKDTHLKDLFAAKNHLTTLTQKQVQYQRINRSQRPHQSLTMSTNPITIH